MSEEERPNWATNDSYRAMRFLVSLPKEIWNTFVIPRRLNCSNQQTNI